MRALAAYAVNNAAVGSTTRRRRAGMARIYARSAGPGRNRTCNPLSASLKPRSYGRETLLLLASDTAPWRAKALPRRVALELRLMLVSARMLPFIVLPVPSVAELPTCQYTFFAWAPLASTTEPDVATVSADPAWN